MFGHSSPVATIDYVNREELYSNPGFDLDEAAAMRNKVSGEETYRICHNMSENDAEAGMNAFLDKYPGLYMKVLSQRYIKNLATLEAMESFYNMRMKS